MTHAIYGSGTVFYVSKTLMCADINLDTPYTDNDGKIRGTMVIPIPDLAQLIDDDPQEDKG